MGVASELTICVFYISVEVLLCWPSSEQHLYENVQNPTVEVAFILLLHSKKPVFISVRNDNSVHLNAVLTVQWWLQFFTC